jgi:hypothetical protein
VKAADDRGERQKDCDDGIGDVGSAVKAAARRPDRIGNNVRSSGAYRSAGTAKVEGLAMSGFWIVLAIWVGGCIGFFAFALMQVAHDNDGGQDIDPTPHLPQH